VKSLPSADNLSDLIEANYSENALSSS
jgi:hypothetical protein